MPPPTIYLPAFCLYLHAQWPVLCYSPTFSWGGDMAFLPGVTGYTFSSSFFSQFSVCVAFQPISATVLCLHSLFLYYCVPFCCCNKWTFIHHFCYMHLYFISHDIYAFYLKTQFFAFLLYIYMIFDIIYSKMDKTRLTLCFDMVLFTAVMHIPLWLRIVH